MPLPLSDSACNRPVKAAICSWRTKAVSLALARRQFRAGAQLLIRFLVLWRLLLDHPAHEDCASDFPHLLREHAERLEDGVVQLRVRAVAGALGSSLLQRARASHRHVVLRPSRLRLDVFSSPFLPVLLSICRGSFARDRFHWHRQRFRHWSTNE